MGTLTAGDPQTALAVLDGLSEIAESAQSDRRKTLGKLQLAAAEEVQRRRSELTADGEQRLDACLAQAYAAVGRPNDAAQVYRRLLERAPKDRALLSRAATGIGGLGTVDAAREAKALWRRLENIENAGSAGWLSARLEVIRCCRQLKEIDECRKLLRVTRLLYPELGGAALKQQFDELEASLGK
jgi:tetratricopeptide (TPR) repeat protein